MRESLRMRRRNRAPFWQRLASLIAVLIAVTVVGIVGSRFANPLVAIGAAFISLIVLLVGGVIVWFAVSFIVERRMERVRFDRDRNGLCVGCGYDLRGLNGRCPECGLPIWSKH